MNNETPRGSTLGCEESQSSIVQGCESASRCPYCNEQGWPTLDGMCHNHYRWLVVNSLRHGADRAEQEWSEAINKVYKVECALGLRAYPSHVFDLETHVNTPEPDSYRGASTPRTPTIKAKKNQDEEILI
jgi:hypothetical protein